MEYSRRKTQRETDSNLFNEHVNRQQYQDWERWRKTKIKSYKGYEFWERHDGQNPEEKVHRKEEEDDGAKEAVVVNLNDTFSCKKNHLTKNSTM